MYILYFILFYLMIDGFFFSTYLDLVFLTSYFTPLSRHRQKSYLSYFTKAARI